MFDYVDPITARKNLNRQGTKVLHFIVDSYNRGVLEAANSQAIFCELLSCICEGRVEGVLNDETMEVGWTLNEEYRAFLEKEAEIIKSENVVKGPWS